jgi:hypothetical protein
MRIADRLVTLTWSMLGVAVVCQYTVPTNRQMNGPGLWAIHGIRQIDRIVIATQNAATLPNTQRMNQLARLRHGRLEGLAMLPVYRLAAATA